MIEEIPTYFRVQSEALKDYMQAFVQLDVVLQPLSTVISGRYLDR